MPDSVFAEYANRNRLFVIKKSGQEVIFNAEMFKMCDFIIARHFKCSLCEFHVYAGEVALRGFDAFIHSPCYKQEDRL